MTKKTKYFELSVPGIKLFIIKMPICISAVKFLSSDLISITDISALQPIKNGDKKC